MPLNNSTVFFFLSAVRNEINVDKLCYDVALQRDEWPWIGKNMLHLRP